MGLYSLVFT